jgi:hypothetical protein
MNWIPDVGGSCTISVHWIGNISPAFCGAQQDVYRLKNRLCELSRLLLRFFRFYRFVVELTVCLVPPVQLKQKTHLFFFSKLLLLFADTVLSIEI